MGAHLAPSVSSPCVLQVSEKQSWTTVDFITLTCGYSVCLFVKADCLRSLVVQSLCLTLWQPMDCSTPGFAVLHYLLEFAQIHVHWVSEAFCLILCLPLLLLPSIFPSIKVFSNGSFLCIRCSKYWSFSFSTSSSNEYSGLITFRIDWFDLLVVQGTLRAFSGTAVQKK